MADDGGDKKDEGRSSGRSSESSGRSSEQRSSKQSTSGHSKAGGGDSGTRKQPAEKSQNGRASAPRAESSQRISPSRIAMQAAAELLELTGKEPEGITGLERSDDGWTVQVEVVEMRRIPNTTDVLAIYEIDADDRGSLMGYRRIRRYSRGSSEGGDR